MKRTVELQVRHCSNRESMQDLTPHICRLYQKGDMLAYKEDHALNWMRCWAGLKLYFGPRIEESLTLLQGGK
jgi:hypothetical protein